MDSALLLKLLLFAALLAASGFFSSSEAALFSLGLHRIRRLKATAERSYVAAQKLLSNPIKLIATVLAGNEFVNSAISVVGSAVVYQLLGDRVSHEKLPFVAVAVVLPFLIFFGEMLPKAIAVKMPERLVVLNARTLLGFSTLVAPFRDLLAWISTRFASAMGVEPAAKGVSEEVFRSMVDAGTSEGELDAQEQRLIHNVFNLDDVKVAQIMTPLARVVPLYDSFTVEEVISLCELERYSRFPVLSSESERVIGTLYVKDLLASRGVHPDASIRAWLRPPLLVSPETSALELFSQFRSRRTHFATVASRGSEEMLGVVTLDDVLSVVFGVIRDERDLEEDSPSKR